MVALMRGGHTKPVIFSLTVLLMVSMTASSVSVAGPTEESESFVIFAVGDIGLDQLPRENPNRYQYDKVARLLLDNEPDAFLMLGDGQHNDGEIQDYLDYYDTFFNPLKDITYPVTGNHDYYVSDTADGYFEYFGTLENCAAPDLVLKETYEEINLGYYSFDIGSWHIVALNSYLPHQCSLGDDLLPEAGSAARLQYDWLEDDLAAHSGDEYTGTIAIMHHPLYDWELYYRCEWIDWFDLDTQVHLWELFYEYGVEMVLSGHNHNYQRWAPQDPYGNYDPEGVRQFVSGTGGAYLWHFPQETPLDCAGDYPHGIPVETLDNLEYTEGDHFGSLRLTLDEAGYEYAFVTVDGEVLDAGSVLCD
jgi:hypothetical protein